jgi:hypothetical protein
MKSMTNPVSFLQKKQQQQIMKRRITKSDIYFMQEKSSCLIHELLQKPSDILNYLPCGLRLKMYPHASVDGNAGT